MFTLLIFGLMLFVSAIASVYDEKLLLKGFIKVRSRITVVLIPGILPFSKTRNPPENRKRFTFVGLALYCISIACIVACIYTSSALKPIEGMEFVSTSPKSHGVTIQNSTEKYVEMQAVCCLCFEAAIYFVNSFRTIIHRCLRHKNLLGFALVLWILILLALGILSIYSSVDLHRKILNAAA